MGSPNQGAMLSSAYLVTLADAVGVRAGSLDSRIP